LELQTSGHRLVTVEKSRSRPGVGNDRTGAQLPLHGGISVAELGPDVMSGKPVKPQATTNRSAAVGFVKQALDTTKFDLESWESRMSIVRLISKVLGDRTNNISRRKV
jgi:hypothetical protein